MPRIIRLCCCAPILLVLPLPGCGRGNDGRPGLNASSGTSPTSPALSPVASPLRRVGDHLPQLQCAGWLNGSPPNFSDDTGGLVVVDLWGTWCSRCAEAAPELLRIHQKYKASGVSFVSATTDPEAMVEHAVQRFGIPWPSGFGATVRSIGDLGARNGDSTPGYETKPTLYLVSSDGQVLWCDEHSRMNHGEDIRSWAERLEQEIEKHISAEGQEEARDDAEHCPY